VASNVPVAGASAVEGAEPEYILMLADAPAPMFAAVLANAATSAFANAAFNFIVPFANGILTLKLSTWNATPADELSVGTITPPPPPDNDATQSTIAVPLEPYNRANVMLDTAFVAFALRALASALIPAAGCDM